MENTARIIQIKAENIKNVKAIDITAPADNVIKISGANGQGKTSVLDCISMAVGGKNCIPIDPIRHGASSAKITLDVGAFVVERHWTDSDDLSKTYLKVTAGEDMTFSSPQSMLDKWVGSLTFDPLLFTQMTGEGQANLLAGLIDFDIDAWNRERQNLYSERTQVNRGLKAEKAQLQGMTLPQADLPDKEISIAETAAQIETQNSAIRANEMVRKNLKVLIDEGFELENVIELRENELIELKAKLEDNKHETAMQSNEVAILADPDVELTKQVLNDAEQINAAVRAAAAYEQKKVLIDSFESQSNDLTEQIAASDEAKHQLLKVAKLPIDDLSIETITDGGNFCAFNGIPFEGLSSSEQLKVSLAIAMALNPKLKVIRITDGSLLDSESMKIVEAMAAENDFQIWLEVVDETGDMGIVIQEGEVLINNYETPEA